MSRTRKTPARRSRRRATAAPRDIYTGVFVPASRTGCGRALDIADPALPEGCLIAWLTSLSDAAVLRVFATARAAGYRLAFRPAEPCCMDATRPQEFGCTC